MSMSSLIRLKSLSCLSTSAWVRIFSSTIVFLRSAGVQDSETGEYALLGGAEYTMNDSASTTWKSTRATRHTRSLPSSCFWQTSTNFVVKVLVDRYVFVLINTGRSVSAGPRKFPFTA